jgi:rhodanese-related sulfurtransferase
MKLEFIDVTGKELPVLASESIAALFEAGSLFVDVRTALEVAEESMPGALHIPLDALQARLPELEEHKEKAVVLFCKSGARSDAACVALRSLGFLHAFNAGGFEDIKSVLSL